MTDTELTLYLLLARQEHLSRPEFQEHWREVNGPLFPGDEDIVGTQFHTMGSTNDARGHLDTFQERMYDGVLMLQGTEEALTAYVGPGGPGITDFARFVAPAESGMLLTEDLVIHRPPATGIGYVTLGCLRRPESIDQETFDRRWREHRALADQVNAVGLLTGYVQSHRVDGREVLSVWAEATGIPVRGDDGWHGVVRGHWPSIACMKHRTTMPDWETDCAQDEALFLDHARSVSHIVRGEALGAAARRD